MQLADFDTFGRLAKFALSGHQWSLALWDEKRSLAFSSDSRGLALTFERLPGEVRRFRATSRVWIVRGTSGVCNLVSLMEFDIFEPLGQFRTLERLL